MKILLTALIVATPTLAHALPPCRVSPRTICTIDSAADQRRIPPVPADAYRFPVINGPIYYRGGPTPPPMWTQERPPAPVNVIVGAPR